MTIVWIESTTGMPPGGHVLFKSAVDWFLGDQIYLLILLRCVMVPFVIFVDDDDVSAKVCCVFSLRCWQLLSAGLMTRGSWCLMKCLSMVWRG